MRAAAASRFPARLEAGYRAFLDDRLADERQRYETLARGGQKPEVMMIGCCDSRVSPEVVFDASPGEIFVVRNVANLMPPAAARIGPRHEAAGEDGDYLRRLELAVIELSLANLMTFPCIRILVERGRLQLHGAYFGVADGVLLVRDPATGRFDRLVTDVPR